WWSAAPWARAAAAANPVASPAVAAWSAFPTAAAWGAAAPPPLRRTAAATRRSSMSGSVDSISSSSNLVFQRLCGAAPDDPHGDLRGIAQLGVGYERILRRRHVEAVDGLDRVAVLETDARPHTAGPDGVDLEPFGLVVDDRRHDADRRRQGI